MPARRTPHSTRTPGYPSYGEQLHGGAGVTLDAVSRRRLARGGWACRDRPGARRSALPCRLGPTAVWGMLGGMGEESDASGGMLETIVGFFRAVGDRRTRAAALKELGWLLAKWAAGGAALTVVVAAAQISALGPGQAYWRFGDWWLLAPVISLLLPLAFILAHALIETAVWLIVLPVYVFPGLFLGDDRIERLGRYTRRLPLLIGLSFAIWFAWAIGAQSVTEAPPVDPSETPLARALGYVVRAYEWGLANKWVAGVAVVALYVMKLAGSHIAAKITREVLEPAPRRFVRLYDANARVLKEIAVDDNDDAEANLVLRSDSRERERDRG